MSILTSAVFRIDGTESFEKAIKKLVPIGRFLDAPLVIGMRPMNGLPGFKVFQVFSEFDILAKRDGPDLSDVILVNKENGICFGVGESTRTSLEDKRTYSPVTRFRHWDLSDSCGLLPDPENPYRQAITHVGDLIFTPETAQELIEELTGGKAIRTSIEYHVQPEHQNENTIIHRFYCETGSGAHRVTFVKCFASWLPSSVPRNLIKFESFSSADAFEISNERCSLVVKACMGKHVAEARKDIEDFTKEILSENSRVKQTPSLLRRLLDLFPFLRKKNQ